MFHAVKSVQYLHIFVVYKQIFAYGAFELLKKSSAIVKVNFGSLRTFALRDLHGDFKISFGHFFAPVDSFISEGLKA